MGASLYNKIPVGHRGAFLGMSRAQIGAAVGVVAAFAIALVVLVK